MQTRQKSHSILRDIRRRPMLHIFVWLGLLFLIIFSALLFQLPSMMLN